VPCIDKDQPKLPSFVAQSGQSIVCRRFYNGWWLATHPQAPRMDTYQRLPVDGDYDLVMGFSLFTHLPPDDAACMLHLARKGVRGDGFLFFSAFCDDSVYRFEDRVPGKPLLKAYYKDAKDW
jgi:hypothetical protein